MLRKLQRNPGVHIAWRDQRLDGLLRFNELQLAELSGQFKPIHAATMRSFGQRLSFRENAINPLCISIGRCLGDRNQSAMEIAQATGRIGVRGGAC
jgi:hypothetical protein